MRLLSAALLLTALAAPAAHAQEERLPDLTPAEFEIQGELEIDLPQLERQPLSGFGPPPRTYVVPAERQPATRPYGPGLEGLVALALAPPPGPAADLPAGRSLRLEAGAGLAAARYARLDAEARSGRAVFFGGVDYEGVGSTVLFGDEVPEPDAEVRFDRFDVRGGVRSVGAVRFGLEGRYARDAYSLPGAIGFAAVEPERTINHGALAATLDADGAVPAALRLGLARTSYESNFDADAAEPELRLDAAGHVEVLRRLVRLEGAVGASTFLPQSTEADLVDYEAGLVLQAHRPGGAAFALGARLLGYTTSVANGDASTNVFAPVARIEVPLGLSARLFAYTDPGVVQRDFAAFFADNPYATPSGGALGFLAPDVRTVDARGGIEVHAGPVGFTAYGGAVYSPTRLFFERDLTGLYGPDYAKARVFEGGADVTVATETGVEASAGVAFRDGTLTELDQAIPFFARVVGRAGLQVPFARDRGRFGLAAYAEGPRPTDRSGAIDAPGWATLTAYGAYDLSGGFGVVLRGERLLGRAERWEGFPQTPYAVMLGVRLLR